MIVDFTSLRNHYSYDTLQVFSQEMGTLSDVERLTFEVVGQVRDE